VEFITALFYEVDEQIGAIPKHPEAHLWPSEVVTLGLLHALKGVGNRPFYRWLTREAVYLHTADNYHRLTRPTFTGAKRPNERALLASQRPSHPW
jgi:hypothetical protein